MHRKQLRDALAFAQAAALDPRLIEPERVAEGMDAVGLHTDAHALFDEIYAAAKEGRMVGEGMPIAPTFRELASSASIETLREARYAARIAGAAGYMLTLASLAHRGSWELLRFIESEESCALVRLLPLVDSHHPETIVGATLMLAAEPEQTAMAREYGERLLAYSLIAYARMTCLLAAQQGDTAEQASRLVAGVEDLAARLDTEAAAGRNVRSLTEAGAAFAEATRRALITSATQRRHTRRPTERRQTPSSVVSL